jgi:Pectate lyase superfamily protein
LNLKRDFGTVGDGVHNDIAALQNALYAAQGSNGTYRLLFIPNGTYVVTNTLVVPWAARWTERWRGLHSLVWQQHQILKDVILGATASAILGLTPVG